MAYTIEQAIESQLFEHLVVSTDSKEIAETAKTFGAEILFIRPPELASDDAPKIHAIRHAFKESETYFWEMLGSHAYSPPSHVLMCITSLCDVATTVAFRAF